MADYIISHGINFIRSGGCIQCGECGCERDACPHFEYKKGVPSCKVYTRRDQYCNTCGKTHQGCIDFPDNPWVWVCRDGICGYAWEREDSGDMDDLPFLNGEPYLRT